MILNKPKNRSVNVAELYASEVKSAGFVPTFVSTFDQMAGGHFLSKSIADAMVGHVPSDVVVSWVGQVWEGGDSARQQVSGSFIDANHVRTGFQEYLDLATHVLTHFTLDGGGRLVETGTTDNVESLFTVAGIIDTQQSGALETIFDHGSLYAFGNASVLPEGEQAFADTFVGKLQAMFNGLSPYGDVSLTEDKQAFDNLSYGFNGNSALMTGAPDGTPVYSQFNLTVE